MKKLLDLILILLVLGTPIFLFVVLPDREEHSVPTRPERNLPLPEVDRTARGEAGGSVIGKPEGAAESGGGTEPGDETSRVDVIPRPVPGAGATLTGYFFRGGTRPMSGRVPIEAPGAGSVTADREGRFSLVLREGDLRLTTEDPETAPGVGLRLPPLTGTGIISVHRYFEGQEGELITPFAAVLLQSSDLEFPRLLVRGSTRLPDDAQVAVRLVSAGYSLESTLLRVRDGRFGGEVPLSNRSFHAGPYTLQFAWGPELATQRIRTALAGTDWSTLEREVQRDLGVFFGTLEMAAEQNEELLEFYREALDELEGTRDFMLVVGAQARGKRNKLLNDEDRAERLRRHPLSKVHKGLFKGKKLQVDAWRALIDQRVPEIVLKYTSLERLPYVTREPQAAHNLIGVAQQVAKHAKLESRIVYDTLELPAHPGNYVPDFDFAPEAEKQQTLLRMRNFSDAVRSFLDL